MLSRLFKKLDLLIVKAFIGPFIATFFITLFVLVLQFFWLYIDDVVGKGVDLLTVARLIMYVGATLVPLALPLAVLLSSIMTLGNLGETFELVAIKSAGISLLRFMRPLFYVCLGITGIAFYFNNTILPIANLKMNTLKYDIIVSKPAFDIKEGVFYDKIEGYVIKIGKKEADDSTIRNVVIYEQNTDGQQDNMIIANSGIMVVSHDKQSLFFTLHDGWRYQEKSARNVVGTQLMRMGFKEYKKVMDLSSFKLNKTDDSAFKRNYQMLTLRQLTKSIDSLVAANQKNLNLAKTSVSYSFKFPSYLDTTGWAEIEKNPGAQSKYLLPVKFVNDSLRTVWNFAHKAQDSINKVQDSINKAQTAAHKTQDSINKALATAATTKGTTPNANASAGVANATPNATPNPTPNAGVPPPPVISSPQDPLPAWESRLVSLKKAPAPTLSDLLPDSARNPVMDRAITTVNNLKSAYSQPASIYTNEANNIRQHEIAWHEKITLSVACLVMFLIGAPLGSIIRKGGIGLPLVFAVIFFVVFFLLNNFGKKFVSQAVLSPIGGMWMATYVLTPIGLFLTYKALHDSQLFNKEYYFRLTKNIRILLDRIQAKRGRQTTN